MTSIAEWRVGTFKSLTMRCYYVYFVSDPSKGKLELVADGLTEDEAEAMVEKHNAEVAP